MSTISYFQKMFAYSLQDNADDIQSLHSLLLASLPHAYGEHGQCGEKWYGYQRSPTNYKHQTLPHSKDLSFLKTREVLTGLFKAWQNRQRNLHHLTLVNQKNHFTTLPPAKDLRVVITLEVTPKTSGQLLQCCKIMNSKCMFHRLCQQLACLQ